MKKLASFGRRGEEQGLRSVVQLSVGFGTLCVRVTRAMADSPPEVGLGLVWFVFKEVICPEVRIGAVLLG